MMKYRTFDLFDYVIGDDHGIPGMTIDFDNAAMRLLKDDVALFCTNRNIISITGNPNVIARSNGYEYTNGYTVWYKEYNE